ncbi:MAG: hypothetical protein L6R38_001137 [Xanthoria sp. 2 TBL-2021]|nr:MAG: hypothetical protein L6R38_001137 [Xanthoria sp. 2 TBL-2021]
MEQQVLQLLAATLEPAAETRTNAERHLELLYTNDAFPISLISIASHTSIDLYADSAIYCRSLRQAALLSLKTFVLRIWSSSLDEFQGVITINDATKDQVRHSLLALATSGDQERKIVSASSLVVSKIASVDFPDQWPSLLPTLLRLIPQSHEGQLHGGLVVLGNLVEDGFDEEQFGKSAIELVRCIYDIATDERKKLNSRALAVSIFRACFDTMELMYQTDKASVKQFMQEASDAWTPFFINVLKLPLPPIPAEEQEGDTESGSWRGTVALKTQVVKALDKIHRTFPHLLSQHTLELFGTIWESLQAHVGPYLALYVADNRQGRLEDADRLPYTLDFLVIEELDYIQTLMGSITVKRELEAQIAPEKLSNGTFNETWIAQIMTILVGFSQITQEDEGLWDFDVNVFLSEETSETANYSPRNACSYLVQKLCRYPVLDSLLAHTKAIYEDRSSSARTKEAAIFVLKQILDELDSCSKDIDPNIARAYLHYIGLAMHENDDFLRARGYILVSRLTTLPSSGLLDVVPQYARQTLAAIDQDSSDVVKVSCIRALQEYLKTLPASSAREFQVQTVAAISNFISAQDLSDLKESEDLLDTLVETLRDAIMADPSLCLEHPALDVLFTMASYGASSFQTTMLVNEAFDSITSSMAAKGSDSYAQLCAKVLPTLTGALDVGDMTSENALSDMAVSLLSSLAEHGPRPLPQNFVAAVMPKLYRLLFSSNEPILNQSATVTIRHIVSHDADQVFAWQDPATGKGGLEIVLLIIDRLLGPDVDDASAAEVGGLTVELVEKAGAERLGPYLMQLLRIVAVRLSTAEHASFIQNLVLVFARLALTNAKEVLDFLAQVQVEGGAGGTGLEVVLRKWLENSVHFSGYDAIRQNVMALTNIYKLHDERLANIQVQGDLMVDTSTRIKTRSQSKRTPDRYSIIPVPLKLTKVLISELANPLSPSTPGLQQNQFTDHSDDEDDEWEDEPGIVDLSNPTTTADLMAYADESRYNVRQLDDETQTYLVDFFKQASTEPDFGDLYQGLTDEEREKLHQMEKTSTP